MDYRTTVYEITDLILWNLWWICDRISFWEKWNLYSKIRSVFAGICVACFALCLLVPPKDLSGIYFLDVGQGDGIMISDGKQKHIFIDGGSTSESAVERIASCHF